MTVSWVRRQTSTAPEVRDARIRSASADDYYITVRPDAEQRREGEADARDREDGPTISDGSVSDESRPIDGKASREDSPRGAAEQEAQAADETGPVADARIVCVANQKGGVGKTTTAVSLAAALAEAGSHVLLVDLDPQGNATTGLGLRREEGAPSTYGVLLDRMPVTQATIETGIAGLLLLPSSLDLAGAEIELVPAFSRELRLREALDEVRDRYDVVLIDCPPTLGLLTVNALVAADEVLLPIQCEYYALEGVGQLVHSIELVRRSLNPELSIGGVVLTMFDARTRLAEQVAAEVRGHFGEKVFRTVIPRSVRLSEAPGFGQPITVFDPSSRGAGAYRRLAGEIAERLKLEARPESAWSWLDGGHDERSEP
jgi:chromosome partitioning protein